jgi:hypothetical protein
VEILEVLLGVDVASRHDGDDRAADKGVEAELAGVEREGCDRQGARRLDDEGGSPRRRGGRRPRSRPP